VNENSCPSALCGLMLLKGANKAICTQKSKSFQNINLSNIILRKMFILNLNLTISLQNMTFFYKNTQNVMLCSEKLVYIIRVS